MSRNTTKQTKWPVRPAKTQINQGIRPVWSVFAVRTLGSWGPNVSYCGQRRLWSDGEDVQADLSLRWAQRSFCWFGRTTAHIYTEKKSKPCSKKVLNSVSSQCACGKSSVAWKPEVNPKILSGKNLKTVKKCNPPDFKFYLGKLTNEISPYGVMLNSVCFFCINAMKTDTKLTLNRMGNILLFNLAR